jgi:hypothetical protein
MIRNSKLTVGLVLALLFAAPLLRAQQPSTDDLKKEIQALSQAIKDMQKDLQEIKALLRGPAPAPPPPQNVLLDLGDNPTRGERTAKLTLVEISDYQ